MKKSFVLLLLFVFSFSFAQSVNDYKYAIVPSKFSFLKEKNEYRLNTLTKLLMEKYGFTAYLDNDQPDELINSNCNKIYVDVIGEGGFINTTIQIVLKDCKNNILYKSGVGKSKEKEYRVAYNQALRAAFDSFDKLKYTYNPKNTDVIAANQKETPKDSKVIMNETFDAPTGVLFAQPIANGFQLIDSTPKVVMKIFKTANPNSYIATKGTTQGVLVSKDNQWFFEYYQNEKLISEKVEVKF